MSAEAAPLARMSAAQYLDWERAQSGKHQFIRGEVYAMAGGSMRHNRLCANVLRDLGTRLRQTPCSTFSADQKVYIPTGDFVYPDASVVCGPVKVHEGTTDVLDNPSVVVEVLSKSTERYDRGDKWTDYQAIPSLTDYVLVSQRIARIEHFVRHADGSFLYRAAGKGEHIELSIGTVLAVDEIFEGAFDLPGDE